MGKSRRKYVARGVPGGYRIWNTRARNWWGDLYELCPDTLLSELNGKYRPEKIVRLLTEARKTKR